MFGLHHAPLSHTTPSRVASRSCGIARAPGLLALASLLVLPLATPALAATQSNAPGQRYTAVAMDLDRGQASQLTIAIERWSSEAERERLMRTMLEKGASALLDTLRDLPRVGYLQVDGGLGWDLHFARKVPDADGGERLIIGTDRPVSFWEASQQPRSIEYPFTVIEIRLKDGQGEGTLSLATRVIPDKANNIVVLENYDMQRIRLTNVKAVH